MRNRNWYMAAGAAVGGSLLAAVLLASTTPARGADGSRSAALPVYTFALEAPLVSSIQAPEALDGDVAALTALASRSQGSAGGVGVDEPHNRILFLVVPGPGGDQLLADARQVADTLVTPVAFYRVPFSTEHMAARAHELRNAPWPGGKPQHVTGADFSPLEFLIRLTVTPEGRDAAQQFAMGSAEPVQVVLSTDDQFQAGRRDDDSPYTSGGAYWNTTAFGLPTNSSEGADCTLGLPIVKSGVPFVTTASHCGQYNDIFAHPTTNSTTFAARFRVSANYWSSTLTDISALARYNGSSINGSGEFFWGAYYTADTRFFTDKRYTLPTFGTLVWVNGANGGSVVAAATGGSTSCTSSFYWDPSTPVTITDLVAYSFASGDPMSQSGDSGAPVGIKNGATPSTADFSVLGSHTCLKITARVGAGERTGIIEAATDGTIQTS